MIIPARSTSGAVIKTYFAYLTPEQQKEFRAKWIKVQNMRSKWCDSELGEEVKLFSNKKSIEEEINDLEDLSLAAYRAMKLLRQQLGLISNDDDDGQYYSG